MSSSPGNISFVLFFFTIKSFSYFEMVSYMINSDIYGIISLESCSTYLIPSTVLNLRQVALNWINTLYMDVSPLIKKNKRVYNWIFYHVASSTTWITLLFMYQERKSSMTNITKYIYISIYIGAHLRYLYVTWVFYF